jgi:hypothetical protein
VRVRDGAGEFYSQLTGETFIPRGNNYIRLERAWYPCIEDSLPYHATFNVGAYDPELADARLIAMNADGYNIVRVFLNGNCLGRPDGGLNAEYVANVADYLQRAQAHDIFVLLTTDDPPVPGYSGTMKHSDTIDWANRQFLTADGMRANGRFWRDLILALRRAGAPLEAVFSYQLRNEQFFMSNYPPFSLTTGEVTTGNGRTYDMADPGQKKQMMEENIVYWVDGIRATILEADPTALVSVGFFWPQEPHPARRGDTRWVTTAPVIRDSQADFIDLHLYPGWELNMQQYVDNFGMAGMQQKPIIMGEFGAARGAFPSEAAAATALQRWQVDSCAHGFDGWLLWTYDTDEQPDFYNGRTGQGLINSALSPAKRPDPCSMSTE